MTAGRGDPQLQFVSLNMEVSGAATALQGGSDPVQPPYGTLCVSSVIMRLLVAYDKVLRRNARLPPELYPCRSETDERRSELLI